MKVLRYANRKVDAYYWDASTKEKEKAAFRRLFEILDGGWKVYSDLDEKEIAVLTADLSNMKKVVAKLSDPDVSELVECDLDAKRAKIDHLEDRLKDLKRETGLYRLAKKGDDEALRELLEIRSDGEYEEWELADVVNPLAGRKRR
jgi:protein subunit release factor A